MTKSAIGLAAVLVLAVGSSASVTTRAAEALPVPGYEAARDVPNAHELPDPTVDYKVLFSVSQGAAVPQGEKAAREINPTLPNVARYLNTLAKYGVPANHRHLVVMFHQRNPDFDLVMTNDAYKARYGQDNPNIALIHALKMAGVEFRACGQALAGRKIEASQVNPDIQIDLWAMTSMMNLQMKGYVRVG